LIQLPRVDGRVWLRESAPDCEMFGGEPFYKDKRGYYVSKSRQFLHVVRFRYHNKKTPTAWEVHHVDMQPHNNKLYNLIALPPQVHTYIHWLVKQGGYRTAPTAKQCKSLRYLYLEDQLPLDTVVWNKIPYPQCLREMLRVLPPITEEPRVRPVRPSVILRKAKSNPDLVETNAR
jgi:hypothetical protein